MAPAAAARRSSYAARRQRCEHQVRGLPLLVWRMGCSHLGQTVDAGVMDIGPVSRDPLDGAGLVPSSVNSVRTNPQAGLPSCHLTTPHLRLTTLEARGERSSPLLLNSLANGPTRHSWLRKSGLPPARKRQGRSGHSDGSALGMPSNAAEGRTCPGMIVAGSSWARPARVLGAEFQAANRDFTTRRPRLSRTSKPAARSRNTAELRLHSIGRLPVPTNSPAGWRVPSALTTATR